MTKARIIDKGLETTILQERNFLAKMNSPFVINMLCSFQNKNNLFMLMELLTGGDLQFHIKHYHYYFSETQLKFLITNLILGLEYIHKKDIIHCNLAPDNIMFDSRGFAKIIGFGDSCAKGAKPEEKIIQMDASSYMAPETIKIEKLDLCADFYSLGTICYKLITGKDFNIKENENIDLTSDIKLKKNYSEFCLDFVSKLLKRKPKERLGSKLQENGLKSHDFLMGMRWDLIYKRTYISPNLDIIKYSLLQSKYPELFEYDYCNKSKDEVSKEEIENYFEIAEGEAYPMYFQYFTSMRVENIMRELYNDNNKYRNYNLYGPKKTLRKSMSSENINDDRYKKNHHHHHHHHHDKQERKYKNIYQLPYIGNKTQLYQKRENKIRNYYEGKLYKYKDYLKNLKSGYKEKKDELKDLQKKYYEKQYKQIRKMYPQLSLPKLPPIQPINNYEYLPEINDKKMNVYNQNNPYNPKMNKIMRKFFDKMNKDRDNFFVKFNKKNRLDRKQSESDDDSSSSYETDSEYEGKISQSNYYDVPYYNPYYPNVKVHNYNYYNNDDRRTSYVEVESSTEKTEESVESETTSIKYSTKEYNKNKKENSSSTSS